jgi:hypothetical protein
MKMMMGFRSLVATALLFGVTEGVFRNEIQVRVVVVHHELYAIHIDRVESKKISGRSCRVVSSVGSWVPVISGSPAWLS